MSSSGLAAVIGAFPGVRFEILPGTGHTPSIEQPGAVAGLITDFLKEVGHG
jgi:pimeloyl-ACP methyl ester carboxylesterase